jgi:hypothetical protein
MMYAIVVNYQDDTMPTQHGTSRKYIVSIEFGDIMADDGRFPGKEASHGGC